MFAYRIFGLALLIGIILANRADARNLPFKQVVLDAMNAWAKVAQKRVVIEPSKVTVGRVQADRFVPSQSEDDASKILKYSDAPSSLNIDPMAKGGPEIQVYLHRGKAIEKEKILLEVPVGRDYKMLFTRFVAPDPMQEYQRQLMFNAFSRKFQNKASKFTDHRFKHDVTALYTVYENPNGPKYVHRADLTTSSGWQAVADRPRRQSMTGTTFTAAQAEGTIDRLVAGFQAEGGRKRTLLNSISTEAYDYVFGKLFVFSEGDHADDTIPMVLGFGDVHNAYTFNQARHVMHELISKQEKMETTALRYRDGDSLHTHVFTYGDK